LLCGSSVAGLLRTRAQHTVEWHMTTRCGLHRPGRHSRLPKRRGRGQPDACFLAVGITPLAAADHLIAWRIPCAPGRLRLLAGAHGGTPQCHSRSAHGRCCAHPQVHSQGVRRPGMPRGARCGHTTSRGHAWGRRQVDVRECSAAHMGSLVVGNTRLCTMR
jgi:hypothetical protein